MVNITKKRNKTFKKIKNKKVKKTRKLLGQGTFGCVYKPSYKCNNNTNNNKNNNKLNDGELNNKNNTNNEMVSKIMTNNNANNEIQNFKIIDKLDPEGKFHIKLESECYLSNNNRMEIKEKGECEIMDNKSNFKNLKFADGGKELYYYYNQIKNVIYKNISPKNINTNIRLLYKILVSLKPIIDGLNILNEAKYTHFDIKLENIVYNIDKNEAKLIDFGVSLLHDFKIKKSDYGKAKDIFSEYSNFFTSYYEVYPFELILCKHYNFKYALNNTNKVFKVIKTLRKSYRDSTKEEEKYNYMLKPEILSYYLKLIKKLYNKYNSSNLAYLAFLKILFNKLDIYSLGICIKKLIDKYNILYNETLINSKNITKTRKEFNKLNGIVNKWILEVIEPKINVRLDVKTASNNYNKIYNYCLNKIN